MLSQEQILLITKELSFSTARSSGPGGQHVNKVNTKVELRFNVNNSNVLSQQQKILVIEKLKHKLSLDGELIIICQSTRSQLKNKQEAINKFIEIITKSLKPRKKRVPTKPSKVSIQKRLDTKKRQSELKKSRKRID